MPRTKWARPRAPERPPQRTLLPRPREPDNPPQKSLPTRPTGPIGSEAYVQRLATPPLRRFWGELAQILTTMGWWGYKEKTTPNWTKRFQGKWRNGSRSTQQWQERRQWEEHSHSQPREDPVLKAWMGRVTPRLEILNATVNYKRWTHKTSLARATSTMESTISAKSVLGTIHHRGWRESCTTTDNSTMGTSTS